MEVSRGKVVAITLIAILAIALVSTTSLAFSQGEGEKGKEQAEKAKQKGAGEQGKDQEDKARGKGSEGEEKARGEEKGKEKARAAEERARSAKQAAEQARAAAEAKGRPEVSEAIGNAGKYIGKMNKAIVVLQIGLQPNNSDSVGFGSAHLNLLIMGERDPMFRAIINTVMEKPSNTLTACLDGQPIGNLTTTPASEDMGLVTGHLRANLPGVSIQLPGTAIEIVEGGNCSNTPILSGSV